ncbi:RNA polymerase sigma-70 factor (ECF subfamily) [Microbacteriaceae bacterium SG_E_30_P1]|uniref:RNA polymerase sigma factor n=1 Tax=Antiquaquibacter oligotrophicus TaxID=2880260 RepID=A0ABT6KJM4_9MICO|nr:RNA polymerase sigma factor [Antiquaquibacter oligotrophicus]MDH6180121.1 RNA polymerase sigma-70 factor (ECF subfamily) [Antiquaquibacter oligotrophicus]UDF14128.1 RNA polymerase sigma factor [Antiquaquibacter oligotrophicus]
MTPLDSASDGILAQRAADGDTAAFEVLVRRHGPFLRAFAIRLTKSVADADDVVQDSLITAWAQLASLQDPSKVRAWLTSIVSRKATDSIRARRQSDELDEEQPDDEGSTPDARAVASSRLEALSAVLDALPEGQRQCWVLKEMGGYSYEEIAERLGMSVATVRGKLARARATVVREMEVWR